MEFAQFAPHPELAAHVRAVWALRHDGRGPAVAAPQLVPPDGCVELVLNYGDPVERVARGRPAETQPRRMFVAEIFDPVRIRWTGDLDLLGVRFAPARASAILSHAGMDEVVGRSVTVDDLVSDLLLGD